MSTPPILYCNRNWVIYYYRLGKQMGWNMIFSCSLLWDTRPFALVYHYFLKARLTILAYQGEQKHNILRRTLFVSINCDCITTNRIHFLLLSVMMMRVLSTIGYRYCNNFTLYNIIYSKIKVYKTFAVTKKLSS